MTLRRNFQTSRRNSADGGFTPWVNVSGALWVLLGDRGLTTSDATVASPNDISTASWTQTGLQSRTATDLVEDGGTSTHRVYQTVPGLVVNKICTLSAKVKPQTRIYAALVTTGGYFVVMFSLSGAGSVVSGFDGTNVTAASISGPDQDGYYTISATGQSSTNGVCQVQASPDGTNTSYTGTAGATAISVKNVSVVQRNVSAWADVVTGSGVTAAQATASLQPVVVAADANFGGAQSLQILGGYLSIPPLGRTTSQPVTCYFVAKNSNATAYHMLFDSGDRFLAAAANPAGEKHPYMSSGVAQIESEYTSNADPSIFCCVYNGASSLMLRNSATSSAVGDVSNGSIGAVSEIRLGADIGGGATLGGPMAAVLFFSGAHGVTTRAKVMRWLSRKYGVAVP